MERDIQPSNLTSIPSHLNTDFPFPDHTKTTGFFVGENALMIQGMLISTIMGALYFVLTFLYEQIIRRISSCITINSDDPVYRKVLKYL